MDEALKAFFFPLTFTLDMHGAEHVDGYEPEEVTVNDMAEAYAHIEGMVDWALGRRLGGGWDIGYAKFPGLSPDPGEIRDVDMSYHWILEDLAVALDKEDEEALRQLQKEMGE
jgi:hypothetical protein